MGIINIDAQLIYRELSDAMSEVSVPYIRFTYESDILAFATQASVSITGYTTDIVDVPVSHKVSFPKNFSKTPEYFFEVPSEFALDKSIIIEYTVIEYTGETTLPSSVKEVTETVTYPKFSIATSLGETDFNFGFLKAFCTFNKNQTSEIYCSWEVSKDGITFTPIKFYEQDPVWVRFLDTKNSNTDLEGGSEPAYIAKPCYPLHSKTVNDSLETRPDTLYIDHTIFEGGIYSFSIYYVEDLDGDLSYEDAFGESHECNYSGELLDMKQYTVLGTATTEVLYTEVPKSTSGKLYYSGNTAYAYGSAGFKNNVLASNTGELVTPISRIIDLPAKTFGTVTALSAWRDYLLATTASEIFLVSKADLGFTTKVISTFIGIPAEDAACIKPTVNGIVFKSHSKVYMFYPNMYSSDEAVLNLTDISAGIEDLLIDYTADSDYYPFAFSTEEAYFLFMPKSDTDTTTCLKYNFNTRVWVYFEYPMLTVSYNMRSVNDIVLYGYYNGNVVEYIFNEDYVGTSTEGFIPYGDKVLPDTLLPIHFELDSGQKTDSLNHNKQFVESKFNVVTLHEKDSFPMRVTVHIDGNPFVTTRDVNTDSAFWKQNIRHVGTLNTNFVTDNSDIFNVFRQMFIRYSGKGKSIRHIIEGESLYPFKIYEIDYRYRNLNVKQ